MAEEGSRPLSRAKSQVLRGAGLDLEQPTSAHSRCALAGARSRPPTTRLLASGPTTAHVLFEKDDFAGLRDGPLRGKPHEVDTRAHLGTRVACAIPNLAVFTACLHTII